MIEFVKLKDDQISDMNHFLKDNKIGFIEKSQYHNMFIVKEDNTIFGIGIFDISKDAIYINQLFIATEKRNSKYGDGLLRTMLFYGYEKGINKAYYKKHNSQLDTFMEKTGFKNSDCNDASNFELMYLDIHLFFSKKCCNNN